MSRVSRCLYRTLLDRIEEFLHFFGIALGRSTTILPNVEKVDQWVTWLVLHLFAECGMRSSSNRCGETFRAK